MTKVIDALLKMGKEAVKTIKIPIQKRKIQRGLESALDKVEGLKLDAEGDIHDLRLKLVKATTENEICDLFNEIADRLQTIKDCENTTVVLKEERKNLFEEEWVEESD